MRHILQGVIKNEEVCRQDYLQLGYGLLSGKLLSIKVRGQFNPEKFQLQSSNLCVMMPKEWYPISRTVSVPSLSAVNN